MRRLTQKQEHFCRLIAEGKNQTESYLTAYPISQNWKKSTVYENASRLSNDSKVVARIGELKAPLIRGLESFQNVILEWAIKLATGNITKEEMVRYSNTNSSVLINLLNKLLPTKSESKSKLNVSGGIEAILAKVKESKTSLT